MPTATAAKAHIGHNSGAMTLDDMLDPVMLSEQWAQDSAKLIARRDELLEGVKRFQALFPNGLQTDDDEKRASDFIAKQLKVAVDQSKAEFTLRKAPFLASSRACDAFYTAGITAPLSAAIDTVKKFVSDFLVKKAAEEKRRRDEQMRLQRAEADRVAQAALKSKSADLEQEAIAADDRAQKAELQANAGIADLSRSRSDLGTVSGLQDNWLYEVTDFAALPDEWKQAADQKIRAAIKPKDGLRSIPGLRIYNAPTARVRG